MIKGNDPHAGPVDRPKTGMAIAQVHACMLSAVARSIFFLSKSPPPRTLLLPALPRVWMLQPPSKEKPSYPLLWLPHLCS